MTDKERLEELEKIVKFQIDNDSHYGRPARVLLLGHDVTYLIEQAKQFKKMKREFADDIDFKRRQINELREQNEYNKQALINQEKSSDREIERLRKRVQELEDIIYQDARQGMIEDLYEENKRYREGIKLAMKKTDCDNTWDFLGRLLEGREKTELPYRIGYEEESE